MEEDVLPLGSRVRVANDSPFSGRTGTILAIQMIATPGEPTWCFNKVELDDAHPGEQLWFENQEVELVGPSREHAAE